MKKIDLMYKLFGAIENHKCVECSNFCTYQASGTVVKKCSVYGLTSSEATDWRNKYQACGQFNKPYSGVPVIEKKKHFPHDLEAEQPWEGQIGIDFANGPDMSVITERRTNEQNN